MTTRFNIRPKSRFAVPPLPSGFQSPSFPDSGTVNIPAVGLEDVDRGLFNLFNKEIPLAVTTDTGTKKVPIIFAAGEKWALEKTQRRLRDANNALILPIITVVRTNVQQDATSDISGRGINQQTGEIVVKRQLNSQDRDYQSLVNRLLLLNQQTTAVTPGQQSPGQPTTERSIGDLHSDPTVTEGGFLVSDRTNNIFETIVIPAPQFFTATYDVTVWTQYTQHTNQILEMFVSSFLPQGNSWKLLTPKGYWFIAHVDGNVFDADTNIEDMSNDERIIKHKFVVKVPGYILASNTPGAPVPVRRYVSNPDIDFSLEVGDACDDGTASLTTLGADDPTLPLSIDATKRRDQRDTNSTRLFPGLFKVNPDDPALCLLPRGTKVSSCIRVSSVNVKVGEVVFSPSNVGFSGPCAPRRVTNVFNTYVNTNTGTTITTDYTVNPNIGTIIVAGSTAPVAVTLESSPAQWVKHTVKDGDGTSPSHPITLRTSDGSLIDGQPTVVISSSYGYAEVTWTGSAWDIVDFKDNWLISG